MYAIYRSLESGLPLSHNGLAKHIAGDLIIEQEKEKVKTHRRH